MLAPSNILRKPIVLTQSNINILLTEPNENQRKLVKYLIDGGFCTIEQMTEIAAFVQNADILNMLFNYENEKKVSDIQTKPV